MKTFKFITFVKLDEKNVNAPDFDNLRLTIEDSLHTPDDEAYGIIEVNVTGEEVENFNSEI